MSVSNVVERKGSSKGQISKGTRRTYDMNFKIMVANEAERTNNMQASRKYGVPEVNIRLWRKDLRKYKNASSSRKSFSGPKKGRFPEVEQRVLKFAIEKRNDGCPISREIIRFKALEEASNLNISREDFSASMNWSKRMMRRNGLSLRRRTTLAQKLPGDFNEKLLVYQGHVISPVYFDMPSNHTVYNESDKTVLLKSADYEKSRITVLLAVTADGQKLPPYVILKRKTMPREKLCPGIVFRVQEKGWMTEELVLDWLNVIWGKRLDDLRNSRSNLVPDEFRGHLTTGVKGKMEALNSDLVIIPGGMTSQLQGLDVVVNKPFKDNLQREYNNWLLSGNQPLTPSGKIKKPSVTLLGEWIATAWQKIEPESIVKGFKKCCISNNINETEDDILWKTESVNENSDDADMTSMSSHSENSSDSE